MDPHDYMLIVIIVLMYKYFVVELYNVHDLRTLYDSGAIKIIHNLFVFVGGGSK